MLSGISFFIPFYFGGKGRGGGGGGGGKHLPGIEEKKKGYKIINLKKDLFHPDTPAARPRNLRLVTTPWVNFFLTCNCSLGRTTYLIFIGYLFIRDLPSYEMSAIFAFLVLGIALIFQGIDAQSLESSPPIAYPGQEFIPCGFIGPTPALSHIFSMTHWNITPSPVQAGSLYMNILFDLGKPI